MATIKKAQKGATTPMQRLKAKYPSADTSARGDIRFSETYSSLPSRQRKESDATKKAFDQKYGKGKPAYRKGGTVKKSASKKGCMSCGGTMKSLLNVNNMVTVKKPTSSAKEGNWIKKAINPKHKGFCSPMTKKTCTPKRKALAKTLKKMARNRKSK